MKEKIVINLVNNIERKKMTFKAPSPTWQCGAKDQWGYYLWEILKWFSLQCVMCFSSLLCHLQNV